MRLRQWGTVLAGVIGLQGIGPFASGEPLSQSGAFHMNDGRGRLAAPMRVFYYRPDNFKSDGPVAMVIHGNSRNADRYRDYWIEAADQYGALIVAPEFTREYYPGARHFNLGNMRARGGDKIPRTEWTFPVLDRVFATLRDKFGVRQTTYVLFGHSAGAQFVHRMILFASSNKISRAVAANAGWYTMPDKSEAFPYGLGGTGPGTVDLPRAFSRKLVVLLGTADNDPRHRLLRRTDRAMRQGPHRFARGHYFFNAAKAAAARLGTVFSWELKDVDGIGHSGRRMVPAAAGILLTAL